MMGNIFQLGATSYSTCNLRLLYSRK
uniref:Uncharacterized protein n=1 Tax=Anguilla anguilla TaxID=7936 RepID=A0A0E9QDX8_ANGAN